MIINGLKLTKSKLIRSEFNIVDGLTKVKRKPSLMDAMKTAKNLSSGKTAGNLFQDESGLIWKKGRVSNWITYLVRLENGTVWRSSWIDRMQSSAFIQDGNSLFHNTRLPSSHRNWTSLQFNDPSHGCFFGSLLCSLWFHVVRTSRGNILEGNLSKSLRY